MKGSEEEMRKTCAEEELHHQTIPCRSSYTAHMNTLKKYSSSYFTTSEDLSINLSSNNSIFK
jgi:hypothetical protein